MARVDDTVLVTARVAGSVVGRAQVAGQTAGCLFIIQFQIQLMGW